MSETLQYPTYLTYHPSDNAADGVNDNCIDVIDRAAYELMSPRQRIMLDRCHQLLTEQLADPKPQPFKQIRAFIFHLYPYLLDRDDAPPLQQFRVSVQPMPDQNLDKDAQELESLKATTYLQGAAAAQHIRVVVAKKITEKHFFDRTLEGGPLIVQLEFDDLAKTLNGITIDSKKHIPIPGAGKSR